MEKDYARAFRIVRAAFGLQQAELAERMPITASQLSLIEAGKRQPSVRAIDALADATGIPAPLISLLASTTEDVAENSEKDMSDLSRALLRVLVSAKEGPRRSLALNQK